MLEKDSIYPFLLVNIGSGVSVVKFTDSGIERVGGTSLGGGLFLGLCNTLTGINDYDKLLQMSKEGDNSNNDLLLDELNLGGAASPTNKPNGVSQHGDLVAVSLGKVAGAPEEPRKEDLVKSLLIMTAYNVSQLSFLLSKKYDIQRVFFSGYFIREHRDTIECITKAYFYFSKLDDITRTVTLLCNTLAVLHQARWVHWVSGRASHGLRGIQKIMNQITLRRFLNS